MKRTILTLFALWMATASLWAYDFSVGSIYYNITSSTNKTVEVTYMESFSGDHYCGYSGSVTIPSSVTYYGTTYSVTSIGSCAFMGSVYHGSTVTSVTIPESVTSIGDYAFEDCTELTKVTIPNSVTSIGNSAFSNTPWYINHPDGMIYINKVLYKYKGTMPENTSIEIKEGTVSISGSAFYNCTGLTSVTIPESITSIGHWAFRGCTGLTKVTIPNSVTSIGNSAFSNTPWYDNQPDGLIYLGKVLYAYKGTMPENTSIEIKEGTVSITESAFWGYTGLTSVTIPESVVEIGGYAFNGCTGLTEVAIPNSVTSIGGSAFYNCTGLTEVTIPNSVTEIGSSAFSGCTGLTTVHFNATHCTSMIAFDYYDHGGIRDYYPVFKGCTNLTTLNFGENVASISDYAFYNCTGLTEVTIPNSVTSIGQSAFYGCTGLTSVTIGNNVTEIGENAFYNCTGLTAVHITDLAKWCEIKYGTTAAACPLYYAHNLYLNGKLVTNLVIPNSVTDISAGAFWGCTGLTSVTIPENVTSIGRSAFRDCTNLTSLTIAEDDTELTIANDTFNNSPIETLYLGRNLSAASFQGKTTLTNLTLGNGITSIRENMFNGCTGLTQVSISRSITEIGESAFSGCTSLSIVDIPESITSIGEDAFYGCTSLFFVIHGHISWYDVYQYTVNIANLDKWCKIKFGNAYANPFYYSPILVLNGEAVTDLVIPEEVTSISDYAFSGCSYLTSVTIPNSVTKIGGYAFKGCTRLTELNYNATNCTSINSSAFSDCSKLSTLNIGDNVTHIPNSAFQDCTGLTSLAIGGGISTVGEKVFNELPSLTNLTIADSDVDLVFNKNIFSSSPIKTLYLGRNLSGVSFQMGTTLEELTINIPTIAEQAYQDYTKMKKLTLGNRVNEIANEAFSGCTGLPELTIPDNVTMIRNSAFSGCTALTSVTLGRGLTRMAGDVFKECANIKSIYCYPTTPPSASTTTFPEVVQEDAILYVPTGCKSVYMTTSPWSNFWDIRELDTLGVEDVLAEDVTITIQNGAIVVNGVDESIYIEVYNLQGQRVYCGYETTIPVNERGIYLVRIANRVVKVVL